MTALTAIITMFCLTALLATLLVLANKTLYVEEDPRLSVVEDLLPHNDCGACGFPGCRAFAEALINEAAKPVQCTVSSADGRQMIAEFLGVNVGEQEKQVARLACAGGNNVARHRAHYIGVESCQVASQAAGGGKACWWGCLGFGDCATACEFDAIHMDEQGLPVVSEDNCIACGDCVEACPKSLFSLHPVSHRLWIACKNQETGDAILEHCEVACTACERCVMDAPPGVIYMQNNLACVNYNKQSMTDVPIKRCPTGAIVWYQADGGIKKGPAAVAVIRKAALKAMHS